MKIATWNVNSIRMRLGRLVDWLERNRPDVLCLQELKCTNEQFPHLAIEKAGYCAVVHGQKTYNGVAILARNRPENISVGMGGTDDDSQARLICAEVAGVRVISMYVPNGSAVGSDKYAYKLAWLKRLKAMLQRDYSPEKPLLLCGDSNVAIDDKDIAHPDAWANTVLCTDEVRSALADVCSWGLVDVFRQMNPEGGIYSWWDYRGLSFPQNAGLRLDHIFATKPLADSCRQATVDRNQRKASELGKPSDHAPVVAEFTFPG